MLNITNLSASIEDKKILKDFNLEIKPGEVHAVEKILKFHGPK